MSLEILKQLDERVLGVIERAEQLRLENERLRERVVESQRKMEEMDAQLKRIEEQCREHESERVEIKNRIEKLLARFDGLDLA